MWIMHPRGFYSAVQHRDDPQLLLIRARSEEDIRALHDLLPNAEPFPLNNSDYEWRLECTVADWMGALASMALEIDYPNFKNAIKEPTHKSAYMACWSALLRIEPAGRWAKRTLRAPHRGMGFDNYGGRGLTLRKPKRNSRADLEARASRVGITDTARYTAKELKVAVRAREEGR